MYRLQLMAMNAMDRLGSRMRDQRGQGTMEYVLIIAVIVVAVLGFLYAFRGSLEGWIRDATNKIQGWMP